MRSVHLNGSRWNIAKLPGMTRTITAITFPTYSYLPPSARCNDKILNSSAKLAFASWRSIADVPESTPSPTFPAVSTSADSGPAAYWLVTAPRERPECRGKRTPNPSPVPRNAASVNDRRVRDGHARHDVLKNKLWERFVEFTSADEPVRPSDCHMPLLNHGQLDPVCPPNLEGGQGLQLQSGNRYVCYRGSKLVLPIAEVDHDLNPVFVEPGVSQVAKPLRAQAAYDLLVHLPTWSLADRTISKEYLRTV